MVNFIILDASGNAIINDLNEFPYTYVQIDENLDWKKDGGIFAFYHEEQNQVKIYVITKVENKNLFDVHYIQYDISELVKEAVKKLEKQKSIKSTTLSTIIKVKLLSETDFKSIYYSEQKEEKKGIYFTQKQNYTISTIPKLFEHYKLIDFKQLSESTSKIKKDCAEEQAEEEAWFEICEECQILIQVYGEENLEICAFCGHYYYEECGCSGFQACLIYNEVEDYLNAQTEGLGTHLRCFHWEEFLAKIGEYMVNNVQLCKNTDSLKRLRFKDMKEIEQFVLENIILLRLEKEEWFGYTLQINNNRFSVNWEKKRRMNKIVSKLKFEVKGDCYFSLKTNTIVSNPRLNAEEWFLNQGKHSIIKKSKKQKKESLEPIRKQLELEAKLGKNIDIKEAQKLWDSMTAQDRKDFFAYLKTMDLYREIVIEEEEKLGIKANLSSYSYNFDFMILFTKFLPSFLEKHKELKETIKKKKKSSKKIEEKKELVFNRFELTPQQYQIFNEIGKLRTQLNISPIGFDMDLEMRIRHNKTEPELTKALEEWRNELQIQKLKTKREFAWEDHYNQMNPKERELFLKELGINDSDAKFYSQLATTDYKFDPIRTNLRELSKLQIKEIKKEVEEKGKVINKTQELIKKKESEEIKTQIIRSKLRPLNLPEKTKNIAIIKIPQQFISSQLSLSEEQAIPTLKIKLHGDAIESAKYITLQTNPIIQTFIKDINGIVFKKERQEVRQKILTDLKELIKNIEFIQNDENSYIIYNQGTMNFNLFKYLLNSKVSQEYTIFINDDQTMILAILLGKALNDSEFMEKNPEIAKIIKKDTEKEKIGYAYGKDRFKLYRKDHEWEELFESEKVLKAICESQFKNDPNGKERVALCKKGVDDAITEYKEYRIKHPLKQQKKEPFKKMDVKERITNSNDMKEMNFKEQQIIREKGFNKFLYEESRKVLKSESGLKTEAHFDIKRKKGIIKVLALPSGIEFTVEFKDNLEQKNQILIRLENPYDTNEYPTILSELTPILYNVEQLWKKYLPSYQVNAIVQGDLEEKIIILKNK